MHETILENRLGDHADAVGHRHQHHHLRLQVGGKTGIRQSRDIDAFDLAAAAHMDAAIVARPSHAGFLQFDQKRFEMIGARAFDVDLAATERRGDDKAAGFDAVGNDPVADSVQGAHAVDRV